MMHRKPKSCGPSKKGRIINKGEEHTSTPVKGTYDYLRLYWASQNVTHHPEIQYYGPPSKLPAAQLYSIRVNRILRIGNEKLRHNCIVIHLRNRYCLNELGDFFIICILKINHLEDKASPGASHLWMSQKKLIFKWKKEYGSEKE